MALSVFDIFKIGIGPSSSHTMGPMLAANMFLDELKTHTNAKKIQVALYGSLACTGIGHATDKAIIVGLCGFNPRNAPLDEITNLIEQVQHHKRITPINYQPYNFNPDTDLLFHKDERLLHHTNGMIFSAYDANNEMIAKQTYYSIGGGFVVTEDELLNSTKNNKHDDTAIPYPFNTAKELLDQAQKHNLTIAEVQRANEQAIISKSKLEYGITDIWQVMHSCIERGISSSGILPGGLNIPRRAKTLHQRLDIEWRAYKRSHLAANEWLSLYAMAVNEENASGGRIVTAPTNGASGVIPAVLHYYLKFYDGADREHVFDFFLTAAAIGAIIKQNASISGAEVGCQGEIGSASAMAAAGLAAALGATNSQIENAAEIALEHHLGMTCDPVQGLVQVPCIERNAFGAIKAVAAASLAMHGTGEHFMPLDNCIKTMLQTGLDMDERYKETSVAGLAVNIVNC